MGFAWVRFRDQTIIHEIRATQMRMKRECSCLKFAPRICFKFYINAGSQLRFPVVFIFFQISFQVFDRIAYALDNIESRVRLLKYSADQIEIDCQVNCE